jgi:hypothetical protein
MVGTSKILAILTTKLALFRKSSALIDFVTRAIVMLIPWSGRNNS